MERNVPDKFRIHEVEVPVPWGVLAAVCWGDPCSQPVLVVHGIQDNAGSFDRLLPLLPRGFYYVCLELPGHGKSTRIPKGMAISFTLYLAVIYRFVRHFSWSRFYYIGHSLGGQLGMYYSAMYPEQIIKLVVLDTIPFFTYDMSDFFQYCKVITDSLMKLEEKMVNSSPPNYTYEEAVNRLMKNRPTPLKKEAAEALVKRMLKKGKSGYYFSTDQRLKFGVRSFIISEQNLYIIKNMQCPVLILFTKVSYNACQEENELSPYGAIIRFLRGMRNVDFKLIDGYHDVHNNEPEVVAPEICEFLIQRKSQL